jgi:hypothetical protein
MGITAIVTAHSRIDQTLTTLAKLTSCDPKPDEILAHVDAGGGACSAAIRAAFPDVCVLESTWAVGPGGGRNKLVAASANEIIASFDDDSYPMDADFFARVADLMSRNEHASVLGAAIFHRGEVIKDARLGTAPSSSFCCCGAVFRKSAFLAAGGFVPLVVAYGMEEEDLALRLFEMDAVLLESGWLRVFHDTDRSHHRDAKITAAVISNIALLTWLRYPITHWGYGVLQVLNRAQWCVRVGRRAGILSGFVGMPRHLWRHTGYRKTVSRGTMSKWRAARAA